MSGKDFAQDAADTVLDPLVEAFREIQRTPMPPADQWPEQMARDLRAELERLGHGGGL